MHAEKITPPPAFLPPPKVNVLSISYLLPEKALVNLVKVGARNSVNPGSGSQDSRDMQSINV